MAKKYIDAEAALKAIEEVTIVNFELDSEFYHESMASVRAIPAADVVEVRHGYWIEQSPDFDLCGVAYYKCSECGREQQLNSHYCQFCGAKMDRNEESK